MGKADRPSEDLPGLPAPVSESPWSADFVMQAIEILPVALRDGVVVHHRPAHAESLIVAWPAGARPETRVAEALKQLGLDPVVAHSTSWRHEAEEVILTYLAVVSPDAIPPGSWLTMPVARADLARGNETAPPVSIDVAQVVEHALRHLAWLIADDAVISRTLPDWHEALREYVPEPFRALGEVPPSDPAAKEGGDPIGR